MLHQVRAPSPFDAASLPPRGSSIAAAVAAAAASTSTGIKRSSSVPRMPPAVTPQPRTASHPPISTASRNDLFNTAWDAPTPPPPPRLDVSLPSRRSRTPPPPVVVDHIPLATSPASLPTSPGYLSAAPSPTSPLRHSHTATAPAATTISKTSSFFASAAADTPPPAPKLAPPGIGLGPAPTPSPLSLSRASSLRARTLPSLPSPPPPPDDAAAHDALSPLHQSPSLPSTSTSATWQPPRPPNADDIQLRLYPEPAYLLGEGRYARAYLGSYKRVGRSGGWTLCAAKRLAADRESQTMGLREAFFLNRLKGEPAARATSPLRERAHQRQRQNARGRVYVVKLIAVKEDGGDEAPQRAHTRSASDQVDGAPTTPSRALRHRSSTIYANGRQSVDLEAALPAPTANVSRLVLVLEHAPLGSLDRLLRTSPDLVGPELWGRWAREAAEALEWVHSRGVVHADVKPSNLLLTDDLHLRLSDFGSSLLIHPAHPPTDGVGLGTLPFSPPELVDPAAPFSFPIDVFALGATLYQCITGREPYRGCRGVEMIHHVRNGGLWDWEERERLSRVGEEVVPGTAAGSPYPSAWRDDNAPIAMPDATLVRRGGSLRVPGPGARPARSAAVALDPPFHVSPPNDDRPERPGIHRVGSAESIKASDDLAVSDAGDSPAGAKLWAAWRRSGHGMTPIERLLRGDDEPDPALAEPGSPTPISRASSLRSPTGAAGVTRSSSLASRSNSLRSRRSPTSLRSPTSALDAPVAVAVVPPPDAAAYEDGAPAMFFLGSPPTRVPDDVRDVLRAMLDPVASTRPTAAEVVGAWDELRVGVPGE
ncbi:Serine/threonine-protein kinase stk11 [Vanrija pseudolonga]|uniref:Serine/threonine-protein kinase stk11 n=1 Tax=Vanrija pseudolonga TaxID=143232 RepID=A0AAF1BNN7_9TREE|nr:Serine/threonine-protein kinase stk11 [Vanrija pseudolonga]